MLSVSGIKFNGFGVAVLTLNENFITKLQRSNKTLTIEISSKNYIDGSTNNLNHFSKYIDWDTKLSDIEKIILSDAQTSGGLLFTIPQNQKDEVVKQLKESGIEYASHIGNCILKGNGLISVLKK